MVASLPRAKRLDFSYVLCIAVCLDAVFIRILQFQGAEAKLVKVTKLV